MLSLTRAREDPSGRPSGTRREGRGGGEEGDEKSFIVARRARFPAVARELLALGMRRVALCTLHLKGMRPHVRARVSRARARARHDWLYKII